MVGGWRVGMKELLLKSYSTLLTSFLKIMGQLNWPVNIQDQLKG